MASIAPLLPLVGLVIIAGLVVALVMLGRSRRRLADELAVVRRRFSDCMDLAPFCAYMKDAEGRYVYENRALVESTYRAFPQIGSFLGRTDLDFFPAEQARRYIADDREVLRRDASIAFDNTSRDADGTVRHWSTVKFPWRDDAGRACVAGVSIDLTETREAREAARASEQRCALALEAGRMGTMVLDLPSGGMETSPQFAILHGRPATKTRLSFDESLAEVHPDDRPAIRAAFEAARRDDAPGRLSYRVVKPDGSTAWIEFVGQVVADPAGRHDTVRGVAFDVTERQEAYEELRLRRDMLRRLIEVQENERQMLCHELHDGMMQYAIGAKMLLDAMTPDERSRIGAERIAAAIDYLTRGIAEGRKVIRGVRSAVLDDLGLAAAIHDYGDQMAVAGIAVEAVLDDDLDSLPPSLRTTVYRVVQESLANVRKHAASNHAQVVVRLTPTEVDVRVSDRGKGFDPAEARGRGFGLVGMVERVRLAGGTCTIDSRPGEGTRVHAVLPITDAEPSRPAATAVA